MTPYEKRLPQPKVGAFKRGHRGLREDQMQNNSLLAGGSKGLYAVLTFSVISVAERLYNFIQRILDNPFGTKLD